jgi:hypothetical protein
MLNMLFGFDTTSFSGVQSIPAFIDQFGNAVKPDGSSAISAARVSFMSSVAFVGKFFGTLVCVSEKRPLRAADILDLSPLRGEDWPSIYHLDFVHNQFCWYHSGMHFKNDGPVCCRENRGLLQVRSFKHSNNISFLQVSQY